MDDAQLTELLCTLLGAQEGWWYSPDPEAVAPAGAVVVFYGEMGEEPDIAAGVMVYSTNDATVGVRYVQVRVRGARGDRRGADTLAGAAFDTLHGLTQAVGVVLVSRGSSANLGADDSGRQERTENYTVVLDNVEVTE